MNLSTAPYNWNSLHRPILYVYDHVSKTTNSIGNNGGFIQFTFAVPFLITPVVGERFIIASSGSSYQGFHRITSVDSATQFTTSTIYSVSEGAVSVLHERLPEIQLYRGYLSTEAYYAEDPITLVATFRPKTSPDNDVQIDVSGYLQGLFSLALPTAGIDHNLFTRFRLYFDGEYKRYYHVLNSGLESSEVESYFANTGRFLTSAEVPYLLSCGNTLLARIQNDAVVVSEFAGALEGEEFDTDFDTDFSTE